MSEKLNLLKRLFESTEKLDSHYCTILNEGNLNWAMSEDEYDKFNDLMIEVKGFLNELE